MRVFKSSYTDQKTGKQKSTTNWYIEFRDHFEQVRRMPALTTRAQSEEFGRKVDRLVACRVAGSPHDPVLTRWVETLPPRIKAKLAKLDLLDSRVVAASKVLDEHLVDFKKHLTAKGNTADYVELAVGRVDKIIKGCGFRLYSAISASQVQNHLATLRTGEKKISAQTFNFYLTAFKSFCRWMVRDGRAMQSRVEYLHGLNVRTDRRHDRRPLTAEEMMWLLDTTESGPVRGHVAGSDRALLYRVAAETGFRSSELRSLTASSFALDVDPPTVTVTASYSKHRKQDVQLLKKSTAGVLSKLLSTKMPSAPALKMPHKRNVAIVLRKDLEAARSRWLDSSPDAATRAEMEKTDFLLYCDRHGRYADFHALRHVTGSYLASANVSPKVAQSIMRHSDINLTMNFYSHAFREDQVQAIEKLPDLSVKPLVSQKKNTAG